MNTNESEFERELRALSPAAPSPMLEETIAREMPGHVSTTSGRGSFLSSLGWALAGAAAAVAVLAAFQAEKKETSSGVAAHETEADFQAVGVTHELVAAEDGGFIYDDDQTPNRLVRYTTLERHAWTNPVTGAHLEVELPREDVILMPVAMQ